jgi:hypothetical protein
VSCAGQGIESVSVDKYGRKMCPFVQNEFRRKVKASSTSFHVIIANSHSNLTKSVELIVYNVDNLFYRFSESIRWSVT